MKIKITLFAGFLFCTYSFAQQKDIIASKEKLSEVVVTGQFEPQSIKKSVFNVRVISKENIKQLAANNLVDVLNQYLNISVTSNGDDGRSKVSMFGLDAQYFKILVDNIPLVSDTGMGTNVDLTQVNLDDVERIEIIEGSMGVTHGANAVTGILNIITKKGGGYKWQISAAIQEETVGKEFAFFDQGRHIQSVKIGHNFNENWFVNIGGNRNAMAGFYDNRQGKDYDVNDGLRGYTQLPKEQLVGNAILGYQKDAFRIFYKFDYYGEDVHYYNPLINIQDNYPFADTYFSRDKRYITNRYYHHLNASGNLFSKLKYNVSVSQQKQERDLEKFVYQLDTKQEVDNERDTYQSKEVFYSTGTLSNFFDNKKVDFQLGYEITNENGFYDSSVGAFRDDNQVGQDIRKRLENYDIFSVAEISVNDKFSIRPGLRFSFQSAFENQYASSLGLRYLFDKGLEARASLGKSYRTPNFDELYTYFVDSNHNMQGNPDLIPENSTSYEVSFKRACSFDSGAQISNNLAVTFLDVDDRIDMVVTQTIPSWNYKYLNINKYKMWNISTVEQYTHKNWNVMLGAAVVGISRRLDLAAENLVSDDKFFYSFRLNSSISYNIPKWNALLAVFYKYNGQQQQYVAGTGADGKAAFFLSELQPYSWMDASVRKSFFKNQFEVTVGARNLFNVTNLQSVQNGGGDASGGAHGGGTSTDMMLGYGRSYFLKLSYNLNFN
ncbi:TonB-dependent receptor [Flavobacterium sp. CFBP9031]|uniref:TonB-dependent receptor plug domain-containing protein n=1 Tax=Flavobacterium sp. CFBP9031 TaxID=3096538 RepID=UPI002A6A13D5|nr:TonB-dependent receptor [Flavobacterium sp. CFBP9031]MDY0987478.1 TonB-dependent receptor [Flavobacterium sp. CFBP9031]